VQKALDITWPCAAPRDWGPTGSNSTPQVVKKRETFPPWLQKSLDSKVKLCDNNHTEKINQGKQMTKVITRTKAVNMFLAIAMAELSKAYEYAESYDEEEIELMLQGIAEIRAQIKESK
jgi:hypothetical protein